MPDYTLHYWPAPCRGQFVRAVLAHAGASWDEADADGTARAMSGAVAGQVVPHMAPPMLVEHASGDAMAQMPAIMSWLGRRFGLMPGDPWRDALALKLVLDANDVLDEITLDGGRQMWTPDRWAAFEPRLRRWLAILEETGARHGLTEAGGWMLGTGEPSLADLAVWALWDPLAERFPRIATLLDREAPATAALVRRLSETPPLARLRQETRDRHGETWCGGEIEASLRAALEDRG